MAKTVRRRKERRPHSTPPGDRGRPEVIVDFVFDDGIFFIAVENIGERPAVDVRVKFDKPFRGAGGERTISGLSLFRGIPFLAPHRRIITLLDTSAAYFARREPTALSATITYVDSAGEKYEDEIRHDLEIYRDLGYLRRPAGPGDSE